MRTAHSARSAEAIGLTGACWILRVNRTRPRTPDYGKPKRDPCNDANSRFVD
jgi:hypothetical protein